jgi:uncharacterized protein YdaU (DUF1376 family)
MPLYIGDYLADTMHLTGPMHGAYLLLIMHHWRRGPLPADDLALATIARTDIGDWRDKIRAPVMAFFTLENGAYTHHSVSARKAEAELKHAAASSNGKRGAEKRWGSESIAGPSFSQCETDNNHNHNHIKERTPKGVPKKAGSRLADDWKPSEADAAYARARGLDVSRTAEDFRGYWLAKAGKGAVKLDWSLTWQRWCRQEADKLGGTRIGGINGALPSWSL